VQNGESSGHQDAPWRSSLAFIDALRDLPPRELANLEQRLTSLSVRRGEVLMRQGDQADALYLVVSGRFAVEVDGRHVAEVGSGAPIGEVAFSDGRRTATVTALRDSLVLKLPHAEFLELTESNPAILKPIMVTLARRPCRCACGRGSGWVTASANHRGDQCRTLASARGLPPRIDARASALRGSSEH
jgi:NTE family protein